MSRPRTHISQRVRDWIERTTNRTVVAGPFQGMRYVARAYHSAYHAKLLGTYEMELHGIVEELCGWMPGIIVDVGAAEGYYAVGLALRLAGAIPGAGGGVSGLSGCAAVEAVEFRVSGEEGAGIPGAGDRDQRSRLCVLLPGVVAYEMNEEARGLLAELARINGVADRIDIRGTCEPGDLAQVLRGMDRPLIVMDVEGAEMRLLTPESIPSDATMVVEVHDAFVPGAGETLTQRFAGTHEVERIEPVRRTGGDFPLRRPWWLRLLPRSYTLRTMGEKRPPGIDWLVFRPRGGGGVRGWGLGAREIAIPPTPNPQPPAPNPFPHVSIWQYDRAIARIPAGMAHSPNLLTITV